MALSLDAGRIVFDRAGAVRLWFDRGPGVVRVCGALGRIGNDAERKVSSGGKAVDEHVISWFVGKGEVVR